MQQPLVKGPVPSTSPECCSVSKEMETIWASGQRGLPFSRMSLAVSLEEYCRGSQRTRAHAPDHSFITPTLGPKERNSPFCALKTVHPVVRTPSPVSAQTSSAMPGAARAHALPIQSGRKSPQCSGDGKRSSFSGEMKVQLPRNVSTLNAFQKGRWEAGEGLGGTSCLHQSRGGGSQPARVCLGLFPPLSRKCSLDRQTSIWGRGRVRAAEPVSDCGS